MTATVDAVDDIAVALGVLDQSGNLAAAFFEHPFDSGPRRAGARRPSPPAARRTRRADGPRPAAQHVGAGAAGVPVGRSRPEPGVARVPPRRRPDDDGDHRRAARQGGGGRRRRRRLDVEVPLVAATGDTLAAVTGTPDGPIRVSAECDIEGGASRGRRRRRGQRGRALCLRLSGLEIAGSEIPPLEIDSDQLTGDVTTLVTTIVQLATTVLGGVVGGAAGDVVEHLPGVLGLDPATTVLPMAQIAADPAASRLVRVAGQRRRQWVADVAGPRRRSRRDHDHRPGSAHPRRPLARRADQRRSEPGDRRRPGHRRRRPAGARPRPTASASTRRRCSTRRWPPA